MTSINTDRTTVSKQSLAEPWQCMNIRQHEPAARYPCIVQTLQPSGVGGDGGGP